MGIAKKVEAYGVTGDFFQVNFSCLFSPGLTIREADQKTWYVATVTNIASCYSLTTTFPETQFRRIYSIWTGQVAFNRNHSSAEKCVSFTSREGEGDFYGNITDYLEPHDFDPDNIVYLCGNSKMIYGAMEIWGKESICGNGRIMKCIFNELIERV